MLLLRMAHAIEMLGFLPSCVSGAGLEPNVLLLATPVDDALLPGCASLAADLAHS